MSSVRKHMYIAGLAASKYPGTPKENYLLLDSDIEYFGEGATLMLLFDIYKQQHGDGVTSEQLETDTKKIGYFDPCISSTREVGKKYNEIGAIKSQTFLKEKNVGNCTSYLEREYSSREMQDYQTCPNGFALKNLLGLPFEKETDSFQVISSSENSKMIHALMRKLGQNRVEREVFLTDAKSMFDRYIVEHPPVNQQSIEYERYMFLFAAQNAYKPDGCHG